MKKLWSCFTDDMDSCLMTKANIVERHHIFGGPYRKLSEKYGFVVPLRPDLHPNGVHATELARTSIDKSLKIMAQTRYENTIGTREDFIREFGRNYLGGEDENESKGAEDPNGWDSVQSVGHIGT